MGRWRWILAVAVLVAAITAAGGTTMLTPRIVYDTDFDDGLPHIPDPDVELGTVGNTPIGWNSINTGETFEVSADQAFSGTKSIKCIANAGPSWGRKRLYTGWDPTAGSFGTRAPFWLVFGGMVYGVAGETFRVDFREAAESTLGGIADGDHLYPYNIGGKVITIEQTGVWQPWATHLYVGGSVGLNARRPDGTLSDWGGTSINDYASPGNRTRFGFGEGPRGGQIRLELGSMPLGPTYFDDLYLGRQLEFGKRTWENIQKVTDDFSIDYGGLDSTTTPDSVAGKDVGLRGFTETPMAERTTTRGSSGYQTVGSGPRGTTYQLDTGVIFEGDDQYWIEAPNNPHGLYTHMCVRSFDAQLRTFEAFAERGMPFRFWLDRTDQTTVGGYFPVAYLDRLTQFRKQGSGAPRYRARIRFHVQAERQ